MYGLFDTPHEKKNYALFTGIAGSGNASQVIFLKPPGAGLFFLYAQGSGGAGGGGTASIAGTARIGGGGGGGGALARLIMPALFWPDILRINLSGGGIGTSGGSVNGGTLQFFNQQTNQQLLTVNGGNGGAAGGSGGAGATAATAPSATAWTNTAISSLVAGTTGGAGAIGVGLGAGTGNIVLGRGGGGGSGINTDNVPNAGSNSSNAFNYATARGSSNWLDEIIASTGGSGGGSSATIAENGMHGGIGCGGGGGGGGVTAGLGGDGGPPLVLIRWI
jgi:hypothetical protein